MRDFARDESSVLFTCCVLIDLKPMTIGKFPKNLNFSLRSHSINRNEDYIHGIEVLQRWTCLFPPPLTPSPKFLTKEVFSVLALCLEILNHFLNKEHVHFSRLFLLFARYSCGALTRLLLLPAVGLDLQMKTECSWRMWLPIRVYRGEHWAAPRVQYMLRWKGLMMSIPVKMLSNLVLRLKP